MKFFKMNASAALLSLSVSCFLSSSFADTSPPAFVSVCQRSPSIKMMIEDLFQRNCARITEAEIGGVKTLHFDWTSDRQLNTLKAGDFSGFSGITELDLSSQIFPTLEANSFQGLTSLKKLVVAASSIGDIEADAFAGLSSLTQLALTGNEIVTLKPGAFHGLSQVTDLDLSTNLLSEISVGAFEGLTQLARLTLKGNQIRYLENNSFEGLANVASIDLTGNQITYLQPELLAAFSTTVVPNGYVTLTGNPLSSITQTTIQAECNSLVCHFTDRSQPSGTLK